MGNVTIGKLVGETSTDEVFSHTGTVQLETKRLLLRCLHPEDAHAMYANWASDTEVTMFLSWPPYESVEDCRAFIHSLDYDEPTVYIWGVELKESGELIGTIGVHDIKPRVGSVETGYVIGRAWWGNGYVPEAVAAIEQHMFEAVGADVMRACHDVANPNSGKVMLKCGMTREGCLRHARRSNAGVGDVEVYSILKEEWERLPEGQRLVLVQPQGE